MISDRHTTEMPRDARRLLATCFALVCLGGCLAVAAWLLPRSRYETHLGIGLAWAGVLVTAAVVACLRSRSMIVKVFCIAASAQAVFGYFSALAASRDMFVAPSPSLDWYERSMAVISLGLLSTLAVLALGRRKQVSL